MKVSVCVVVGMWVAAGASADWELAMARARQYVQEGRFAEAETQFAEAVRLCTAPACPDVMRLISLTELAATVQALGRLREAERLFLQALEGCEALPEAGRLCRGALLSGLASVYVDLFEFAKAEPLLLRALSAPELTPQLEIRLSLDMATLMRRRGKPEEAEAYCFRGLALSQKDPKADPVEVAGLLMNIAVTRLERGRAAEAVEPAEQAVALLESALGPQHPLLAPSLGNLAQSLSLSGRHGEALALAAKAQELVERTYGPTHIVGARTLMQCAQVFRRSGRTREARRLEKIAQPAIARHERENLIGHSIDIRAFQASSAQSPKR